MIAQYLSNALSNLLRLPHYDSPYFWYFLILSTLSGMIGGAYFSTKGSTAYFRFLYCEMMLVSLLSTACMIGGLW